MSFHTRKRYEITDVGIMYPEEVPTTSLRPGQVGYIACNMKESSEGSIKIQSVSTRIYRSHFITAHIGDTLHRIGEPVDPIPGFKPAKAMVGVGIIISRVFPKRFYDYRFMPVSSL